MTEKLTMKDMCETIEAAGFLCRIDGTKMTAYEIFNYSPSGELMRVFEWYEIAKKLLEQK